MRIKNYIKYRSPDFSQFVKILFGSFFFIYLFIGNSYSQDSPKNFSIQSGCDLSKHTSGPELLEFIKNNGLSNIININSTTQNIAVFFQDSGRVNFGTIESFNPMPSELKRILTDFQTDSKCINEISTGESSTTPGKDSLTSFWDILGFIPNAIAKNSKNRAIRFLPLETTRKNLLNYYVNPYLQAFGGDPLGIPFSYKAGVGLTVGFGTPYSGPLETDMVKGGLHLTFLEVSVTGRIKEMVMKYSSNTNRTEDLPNTWIGNWNNIFMPHLGIELAAEIPLFRISYFSTIDTLQDVTDNPMIVRNEVTGEPMKNNVIRGDYFGFEVRTPYLVFYNSSRAKFYFAKSFGEYHLGFVGREMRIDDLIFDFRINATFPGKRDFQFLTELYLDNIWPGFSDKAFGIGPSLRFGMTPSNKFGIITALINARFKVGDFFDKNLR